jgi:hypothetical protein
MTNAMVSASTCAHTAIVLQLASRLVRCTTYFGDAGVPLYVNDTDQTVFVGSDTANATNVLRGDQLMIFVYISSRLPTGRNCARYKFAFTIADQLLTPGDPRRRADGTGGQLGANTSNVIGD